MPSLTHIVSFNGYDLTDVIEQHSDQSNTRVQLQTVPKRHGALLTDIPVLDVRKIQLKGVIYGTTQDAVRTKIREIEAALGFTRGKLKLFSDRFYWAWKTDFSFSYVPSTGMLVAVVTMGFACDDPFEYDEAGPILVSQILTTGDTHIDVTHGYYRKQFTIHYTGTAFVYLYIVVSADQGVALTEVLIRNTSLSPSRQESYTAAFGGLSGIVNAGTSLIIDGNFFTVQNNGIDDLVNWQGVFLWLQPGDNVIQIEGNPATYQLQYNLKYV